MTFWPIQTKCEVETGFSACTRNRTTWQRSALSECFSSVYIIIVVLTILIGFACLFVFLFTFLCYSHTNLRNKALIHSLDWIWPIKGSIGKRKHETLNGNGQQSIVQSKTKIIYSLKLFPFHVFVYYLADGWTSFFSSLRFNIYCCSTSCSKLSSRKCIKRCLNKMYYYYYNTQFFSNTAFGDLGIVCITFQAVIYFHCCRKAAKISNLIPKIACFLWNVLDSLVFGDLNVFWPAYLLPLYHLRLFTGH